MKSKLKPQELKIIAKEAKKVKAKEARETARREKEEARLQKIAEAEALERKKKVIEESAQAWAAQKLAEIELAIKKEAAKGLDRYEFLEIEFPIDDDFGNKLHCPGLSSRNDPSNWESRIARLPRRYQVLWESLSEFKREIEYRERSEDRDDCENPYASNVVTYRWTDYFQSYKLYVCW